MKKEFIELYNFPKARLAKHITENDNERMILSGKYGIGKTSFLKHFFHENSQKEILGWELNYNKRIVPIHLYPVNYSIASNEDIFKYIKFDILHELLKSELLTVEPITYSKGDTIQPFIKDHILDILEKTPIIGKSLFGIQKEIWKLYNKYLELHKDLNKDEGDIALAFMNEIVSEEGSIYEDNFISQIISDFLDQIRNDHEVEIILIIDDLDRVDPHHIFRLFNVFAAHFDTQQNEGQIKFNLDKIMFVCDINNVRNIFHSKYGDKVDFSGYIDKFYSKEVFEFDNSATIKSILENIISSIKIKGQNDSHSRILNHTGIRELLSLILLDAINSKEINLRALFKFYNSEIVIDENISVSFGNNDIQNWQSQLIMLYEILIKIFGSKSKLKDVFKTCSKNKYSFILNKYETLYQAVLLIVAHKEHHFNHLSDKNIIFHDGSLKISFHVQRDRESQIFYCNGLQHTGSGFNEGKNVYYLCSEALVILEDNLYF